jgi:hypothetical protein
MNTARCVARPAPKTGLPWVGSAGCLRAASWPPGSGWWGVPSGGRAYLVPSLHLLAAPMRPVRCVPSAQRARQASLLATLRHEYARQGVCVVIVYGRGAVDDCSAAPGTVAALLRGPGAPAFGVGPDGIASVTVSFRGMRHPPRSAVVRGNFWRLPSTAGSGPTACGLDWRAPDHTVLRTVRRCTPDTS